MMPHPPATHPPAPPHHPAPESVRAQILATEHWSLLATRSMAWSESFSRATLFLTMVSATVVALALVAQATDFGSGFFAFALLLLPVPLLVGLLTFFRMIEVNDEDGWLIIAMNRLRHAYLELAPELEPYFTTSQFDDLPGMLQTFGPGSRLGVGKYLASTTLLVGIVDAVVAAVLGGLASDALGASPPVAAAIGVVVGLGTLATLMAVVVRRVTRRMRQHHPRFPSPPGATVAGRGARVSAEIAP